MARLAAPRDMAALLDREPELVRRVGEVVRLLEGKVREAFHLLEVELLGLLGTVLELDLLPDLVESAGAALANVLHPDEVEAEVGLDRFAQLSDAEGERRLLEGGNPDPAPAEAEIASRLRRARIVGELPRQAFERLAGEDSGPQVLRARERFVPTLVIRDQDVAHAPLLRRGVARLARFVPGLEGPVGDVNLGRKVIARQHDVPEPHLLGRHEGAFLLLVALRDRLLVDRHAREPLGRHHEPGERPRLRFEGGETPRPALRRGRGQDEGVAPLRLQQPPAGVRLEAPGALAGAPERELVLLLGERAVALEGGSGSDRPRELLVRDHEPRIGGRPCDQPFPDQAVHRPGANERVAEHAGDILPRELTIERGPNPLQGGLVVEQGDLLPVDLGHRHVRIRPEILLHPPQRERDADEDHDDPRDVAVRAVAYSLEHGRRSGSRKRGRRGYGSRGAITISNSARTRSSPSRVRVHALLRTVARAAVPSMKGAVRGTSACALSTRLEPDYAVSQRADWRPRVSKPRKGLRTSESHGEILNFPCMQEVGVISGLEELSDGNHRGQPVLLHDMFLGCERFEISRASEEPARDCTRRTSSTCRVIPSLA